MAQGFNPTQPQDDEELATLAADIRANDNAVASLNSGPSAPANPIDRMLWLDTSQSPNILKIYDQATSSWKTLDFIDILILEVVQARGTASRLDARLDVALNEDGTLKASTTLNPDEWKAVTGTPTKTAANQFTKTGDQTQLYQVNRRVKMTPGPNYSRVTAVSYNAGTNTTTVTVADNNVPDGITAADIGLISPAAASTGVDAKGLASPSGGVIEDYIAELIAARGSKTTLDARLDIALNEDGILKLGGLGTARLRFVSATEIRLGLGVIPLKVGGAWKLRQVSAEVSATNGGLAANTLYYVYAYDNAGATALEFSTTGHTTDADFGVEVKGGATPDPTRTLVGMVKTSSTGTFVDLANQRWVRSWYGERGVTLQGTALANTTMTNTSPAEIGTGYRVEWLNWAGEVVHIIFTGHLNNTSAGAISVNIGIGLDTTTAFTSPDIRTTITAGWFAGFHAALLPLASEGAHFAAPIAALGASGTVVAVAGSRMFGLCAGRP